MRRSSWSEGCSWMKQQHKKMTSKLDTDRQPWIDIGSDHMTFKCLKMLIWAKSASVWSWWWTKGLLRYMQRPLRMYERHLDAGVTPSLALLLSCRSVGREELVRLYMTCYFQNILNLEITKSNPSERRLNQQWMFRITPLSWKLWPLSTTPCPENGGRMLRGMRRGRPSYIFGVSRGVSYRPWQENGRSICFSTYPGSFVSKREVTSFKSEENLLKYMDTIICI